MDRGVLQQYCPPLELYGEPTNLFVADFMGNPTMNFVDVKARKSENGIELTCPSMNLTFHPLQETEINEVDDYVLGLRPEAVLIQEDGQIEGTVISSLPSGMETTLSIEVKDIRLSSVVFGNIDFAMDSKVNLTFKGNTYILFNKRTRNKVGMGALTIK
jgi:multiple sugar transport system ATP-binding protein